MTRVALLAQLAHAFGPEASVQQAAQDLANAVARSRSEPVPAEPLAYPSSGRDPLFVLFELYAAWLPCLQPRELMRHLPALLRVSLEPWPEDLDGMSCRSLASLGWLFGRDNPLSLRSLQGSLLEPLTAVQRAGIAAYLEETGASPATREAWARVVHHDASGGATPWFDVFWPLPAVPRGDALLDLLAQVFPVVRSNAVLPDLHGTEVPFHLPFVQRQRLLTLLPQLALFALRQREHELVESILQQLLFLLQPFREPKGAPLLRECLADLTQPQRVAVAGLVVELFPDDDLCDLWLQAASLEGPNWLKRLRPPEWEPHYRRASWLDNARVAAGVHVIPVRTRADRDHASVVLQIDAAFDGVAAPGPGERTLFEAEEADCYGTVDVAQGRESHRGRWQDLPTSELRDGHAALSFLSAAGLVYYTPSVMVRFLHWHEIWTEDMTDALYLPLFDGIGFAFTPRGEDDDLREFHRERLALFTAPQRAAICAFMRGMEESPHAVAAWDRVVAHDASGAAGSWFEVWWPARERPSTQDVIEQVRAAFPGVASPAGLDPRRSLLWLVPPPEFAMALAEVALFALSAPEGSDRGDAVDHLARALHPNWGARDHAKCRARLLTLSEQQRRAVSAVCEACVEKSTLREMWRRAVAHEGDDWFEYLKLP